MVESQELAQLVSNLRAVGCPDQTIQELICVRACRAMRQQLMSEQAERDRRTPYWAAYSQEDVRAQINARRAALDELDAALEQLLGTNGASVRSRLTGLPAPYPAAEDISLDKSKRVREIERRYRQLYAESLSFGLPLGFTDPEALNRSRELNRQKLAEIRQLLTPEEYDQYLARQSSVADYVRNNLPEAKSEDEFRRMVKLAAELELDQPPVSRSARYGIRDEADQEAARVQQEKLQVFEQRLAQELGEDRVASQKQEEAARQAKELEQQARQREVAKFVEIGASMEEADTLYDRLRALQPKFEQRQKELLKPDATPEQIKAFEAEVKAEFERVAAEVIGPEKAKAWVNRMGR